MILPGVEDEALRLLEAARDRGVSLRALGGVGVKLHSPSAAHPCLSREYRDIDLATTGADWPRLQALFPDLGYEPARSFNALHGETRGMFHDTVNGRDVDVFVGVFEMCHKLSFRKRLCVDRLTLPLAELLATKLQIVELNEKDIRDALALVLDHEVGPCDDETINSRRLAELCSGDWGMYKTLSTNVGKLAAALPHYGFTEAEHGAISGRLDALLEAMELSPKSLAWRLRAAVGERLPWYELPETVKRGPEGG